MPDAGLLLTLPAQSVAVRLLLCAVIALLASRILLRTGLRVPRVRVAAVLLPACALVVILAVSLGQYRLPALMIPNRTVGSVLVPIENTYAYLAPLALPALAGLWAMIVLSRVGWRIQRTWRFSRHTARTAEMADVPDRVHAAVDHMAAQMGIDSPPVGLAAGCPGGASVVGARHPTILLDPALVDRLDPQELEGVVAHELAHVCRRDNLVALLFSITRDVVFFVPGGRWSLRQLLVEREIAADHLAVRVTQRPGALAGGLLKVLEASGSGHACAALLPQGTLVRRVSQLVEDRPAPSRTRAAGELTALSATFAVVLVAATLIPRLVAGGDPNVGLGVLLTAPQPNPPPASSAAPDAPRVFSLYRGSALRSSSSANGAQTVLDDNPDMVRPSNLTACEQSNPSCGRDRRPATLALRPQPRVEDGAATRWRARQVVRTGDVLRIYWLTTASS